MELAILLSLAASVCTATFSVCQRLGARHLEQCGEMRGFDALLVFRLARVRGRTRWREWGAVIATGITWGFIAAVMAAGSALITHTTRPPRPEAGEATNRELTGRSR